MRTDNAADMRLDAMLKNCIFYISPMYEFSHSLGHNWHCQQGSRYVSFLRDRKSLQGSPFPSLPLKHRLIQNAADREDTR